MYIVNTFLCFGNGSSFLQNTESSQSLSLLQNHGIFLLWSLVHQYGSLTWRVGIPNLRSLWCASVSVYWSSITSFLKMVTLSKKLIHGAFIFLFDEQRTSQTCITSTFIFKCKHFISFHFSLHDFLYPLLESCDRTGALHSPYSVWPQEELKLCKMRLLIFSSMSEVVERHISRKVCS